MLPSLLHGEESAVFGDKGYYFKKDKKYARDAEVFWGVLEKRKPKRKVSSLGKSYYFNIKKKQNMTKKCFYSIKINKEISKK